jgi:hypothetical protein
MEGNEYTGSVAAGLAYFVLGARLVWRGIRTRSTTERLLGLTFLVWTLSYVFWVLAVALQGQTALGSQLFIASHVGNSLGAIGIAYFPLLAFRRGVTWAKWLSAGITICLIVGTAGSVWAGDPEGVNALTNIWWWPEWIGEIASAIWIGAEGLNHYGTSRKRVRLGLCEPIVGHRYLLWGLAGAFWTLLGFLVVVQFVEFWVTQSWSASLDNLVGFCEVGAIAMIWLAFFAPARYQRRINSSAISA